jgi:hypothetical protein
MSDLAVASERLHGGEESIRQLMAETSDGRWLGRRKIMSKWTSRICAALIAVAMVTPASALPISENTIRRECRAANGTYTTTVIEGTRFSTCTYRDYYGDVYRDYYSTRP